MQRNAKNVVLLIGVIMVLATTTATTATATETKLLELARETFTEGLWPGEERLFRNAAIGEEINFMTDPQKPDDPALSETWSTNRVIRAKPLVWLQSKRRGEYGRRKDRRRFGL